MRRLGLALTFGVLVAGTAAQAQVTNVTGTSTGSVQLDGTQAFTAPGTFNQGINGSTVSPTFAINPSTIAFDAGSSSVGDFVRSSSTSSVDITIKNGGSTSVTPTMKSQITAAGLGFYLADTTSGCGGNIYTGCAQTTGGETFAQLSNGGATVGSLLSEVGFDFKVSAGGTQVLDFTGLETMTVGSDGNPVVNNLVLSDLGVLQGLVTLKPGGAGSALGYAWNASDITLGLGADLAAGASEVVTYSSTVTTFSRTECVGTSLVCLVAYSAFGDPVGQAGAVTNLRVGGGQSLRFGGPATFATGITGVNFTPTIFDTPTFDNGVLTFDTNGAGVPEPATWMSLIGGFGLLGAALRRRRVLAYN